MCCWRCALNSGGVATIHPFVLSLSKRGGAAVYLEVRDSNEAAQALYRGRGFLASGRRKGYYRLPAEDAVVMRRPRAEGGGGD